MDGFASALRVLPRGAREGAERLNAAARREVSEFRLRRGLVPTALLPEGERALPSAPRVDESALAELLELATAASPYAAEDTLRQGFVTAPGGVRVGVCGQAVPDGERIRTLRCLTSACVRVPREARGCARALADPRAPSTLILSPPGAGKTTLLRDMVRLLSEGGARVALCDERGEIAAFARGEAGFDVGPCTDVLTGGRKSETALLLLRTMDPEWIAMDEITAPEDAAACEQAANCGVRLLATVHAADLAELRARPLTRALLEMGVFRRAVLITREGGARRYREAALCG